MSQNFNRKFGHFSTITISCSGVFLLWRKCNSYNRSLSSSCYSPSKSPLVPCKIRDESVFSKWPKLPRNSGFFFLNSNSFMKQGYLSDMSTATAFHKLKHYFARHGMHEVLICDQDGQYEFTSDEFVQIVCKWKFKQIRTTMATRKPTVLSMPRSK